MHQAGINCRFYFWQVANIAASSNPVIIMTSVCHAVRQPMPMLFSFVSFLKAVSTLLEMSNILSLQLSILFLCKCSQVKWNTCYLHPHNILYNAICVSLQFFQRFNLCFHSVLSKIHFTPSVSIDGAKPLKFALHFWAWFICHSCSAWRSVLISCLR